MKALLLAQVLWWSSWYTQPPEPPTYANYNYAPRLSYYQHIQQRQQFSSQFNRQQANMSALVERKRYHRMRKLAYIRGY